MESIKISTIIIFISIITFKSVCYSQHTFEFTIKDTVTDQVVNDALELSDGSFILLCQEVYPIENAKPHLVRISSSGKLLLTKTLEIPGSPSGLTKIIQTGPNLFAMCGTISTNLWLYETDSLFTEVRNKIMPIGNYQIFSTSCLMFSDEYLFCSGTVTSQNQLPFAFIYKISTSFDSIQLKVFTEHTSLSPVDLVVKYGNTGYNFFMTGFGQPKLEVMIDLDKSLSIHNIYGVSNDVFNYSEAKRINASNMVFCGEYNPTLNPSVKGIGVLLLDSIANIKHEYHIVVPDMVEWPGLRSRVDFIFPNLIYIGGTHNFCHSSEFCSEPCWFSLNQFDTTLHSNWQYYYGENANYTQYGIKATKDKGCLLFGSRYDFHGSTYERDIYVFKVDPNGRILGIDNIQNPKVHTAILFPNPGKDFLTVEIGPQITGAKLIMTDLNGHRFLNKTLNDSHNTINTQAFSSGTYPWQIIFNNKVIETGKWIKP